MSEEAALLDAIVAEPDEDVPRLAYADWLDENDPDDSPSPSDGSSSRAEFIRIQCRLAAGAFDDPDYPELLEREADLADWLNVRDRQPELDLGILYCPTDFEAGEWGRSRRGFPEVLYCQDYLDSPEQTVEEIVEALEKSQSLCPAQTLVLEDAATSEIALLVRHPIFQRIRGLHIDGLVDATEDEAIASLAGSRWALGLRRLSVDHVPLDDASCEALARSPHLKNLECLAAVGNPISARAIKAFGESKWFRKLRRLHLWLGNDSGWRALADLPRMPRLISLTLNGSESIASAAVKRFAASNAFPALAHLDLSQTHMSADQIALLARGRWPLRHLRLSQNEVRKTGVEALVGASFASTLRVLELPRCEITAAGIQELANSEALIGLRHLNLAENPIGPGGLAALAASQSLSGLRRLDLQRTNTPRGPIAARDVLRFLTESNLPNLRHLNLSHLPVGIRGARLLATKTDFANLRRLGLQACAIGEAGTKHLITSNNLTDLVALDVSEGKTGSGAGKLLNAKVLAKLACCKLGTGIPKGTATRLRRRPGVSIPG
jgi:uncharacterized protein (TIGR02996 family)